MSDFSIAGFGIGSAAFMLSVNMWLWLISHQLERILKRLGDE